MARGQMRKNCFGLSDCLRDELRVAARQSAWGHRPGVGDRVPGICAFAIPIARHGPVFPYIRPTPPENWQRPFWISPPCRSKRLRSHTDLQKLRQLCPSQGRQSSSFAVGSGASFMRPSLVKGIPRLICPIAASDRMRDRHFVGHQDAEHQDSLYSSHSSSMTPSSRFSLPRARASPSQISLES